MRQVSGHIKNDLDIDAWGRQKAIIDKSAFHGMFTFNVPVSMWYETFNGTARSFTSATSVNGELHLSAGATLNDMSYLRTFRNPRYEPNRGALYSSSIILPNASGVSIRRFGTFTAQSGVFFELNNGVFYGVIRTTIDSVTTDDKYIINTERLGIDLEKGNVYDIQYQWRGVGNYSFFINLQEVRNTDYLGKRTHLTMFNPALPLAFESVNEGDNDEIVCGCVDVTTEGGLLDGKTYGSIGIDNESGQVALDAGYNTPVIAVRSKVMVGSYINTRDTLSLLASAYADQKSFFRVWTTRDFTAITDNDQIWQDYGDGHLEYMIYDPTVTTSMSFDTAKASVVFGCRVDLDSTYSTSALFEGRTEIWKYPGDMFVFTMHRENGLASNCGVSYEFAEEI